MVASLIKDFKAANPNGFLVYFSDHGEEVYDTPPHKTQGRNEDNPTRHMYTIPFLLWTSEKWQATHPRDFSQDVDRKYSLAELIHTWSDKPAKSDPHLVRFGGLILRRLRSNPFSGESAVQRNYPLDW